MRIYQQATLSVIVGASVFLAACSSTPVAAPVTTSTAATPGAPAKQAASQSTGSTVVAAAPLAPYLDPKNPLSRERSVYFNFDQAIVKPEAAHLVEMHGHYLAAHPELAIKIEGNTDRQGGAEYNLALGQKRADAVVKALIAFGAKDTQLEAVSYGMEKPKALGNDETAYAENRRADLVYPQK